ncbi:hypothetical protein AX16_001092 [Volvariella volvacea WC 439]|nr:hypothetical protein AX16_001092 [Volvariella volvacea WC 439]
MLHQLPTELLEVILQPVDNRDLCNVSTLCRSLHTVSLNTLFSTTKAFDLSSNYRRLSKRGPGTSDKLLHQYNGLCITLRSDENLNVLLGLRLALPHVLAERQITSVVCTFNSPLRRTWAEIKNLGRFLSNSPISSSLESVVVDFVHSFGKEGEHEGDPIPEGVTVIKDFLQLFSDIKSGGTLPRCVSLTMLNGLCFPGWAGWEAWNITLEETGSIPSWLKTGTPAANLVQSFISIPSQKVASIFRPNSSQSASPVYGLLALNLHSEFIFNPLFFDHASTMLTQFFHHSLRSLSLDCSRLSEAGWTSLLARVSLPHLQELHLGQSYIPPGSLINFLVRHRSIEVLDIGTDLFRTWSSKRPPGLLPKLKTLKGTEGILSYFLPSPSALPKLQSITIIIFTDRVFWPLFWFWLRAFCANPGISYKLEIWMEGQFPTMWLRVSGVDADYVKAITSIEIYAWPVQTLLTRTENRSDLIDWLKAFPVVSRVDIVGCAQVNEASRKELYDVVKATVPMIESFCVDGRSLDSSM